MSDERDYIAEMDARIEAVTKGSDWVAAVVAAKLHASLLESDPDLLDGWLRSVAPDVLRQAITLRVRQSNARARRGARVREFADAARDMEDASDGEARETAARRLLSLFEQIHTVDDSDTRKRACDMTGPEHLFVAECVEPHRVKRLGDERGALVLLIVGRQRIDPSRRPRLDIERGD